MSEPARNRFALDLEDLERQLRGAAQAPKPGQATDPLAELTRIVGQDDPLKDIFAHRGQPAPTPQPVQSWQQPVQSWQPPRQEPSFAPAPVPPTPESSAPPAELRGALDEFEALLRRTDVARPAVTPVPAPVADEHYDEPEAHGFHLPEPQSYQRPASVQGVADVPRDLDQEAGGYSYAYEQSGGYSQPAMSEPAERPMMADDDAPDLEPRRSRKGVWLLASVAVIGIVGVAGASFFRSSGPVSKDGLPLVINADRGPTKVEPTNPGGAEIPNQNKQIYEKVGQAPSTQTQVVSREEQPVDVQQAARSLPARVVLPAPGSSVGTGGTDTSGTTNPLANAPAVPERSATPAEPALAPGPAVPGLGEPRRVRTVAIRPDGTPAPPPGANGNGNGNINAVSPSVTGSAPAKLTAPAAANPGTTGANSQPRPRPATTPEAAKVQERVATPAPATTPPLRVASAAPAATNAAPATAAIRAGTGDFAVQLGAPGSEAEARATFSALQRKYPDQLGGQAPIVRKTELAGGKTVYRLRVGPYSRDDATAMCTQLQTAGGQCFIAKN
ncbi:hypothetical protein J2Y55_001611 [Bosea sp. BE125]|uniref:SPOR domain-containing protein n=1 Tax=Bosea sp. BE125 TaxID=2817909 RepID=UPI00286317E9|nr:SPOR domain-containing protein [Bosea sp. BE125]MDR6870611.1 hypothetical protein [Bosea sp. BE125]